ncbi:Uu.00g077440.m01.CDS01 [Anthostomella pinea]|uniref:Uu.00g077440.m01.CDS01 n=1 Tax=Anthostomella pinea TaxID=933095 RepID=A0AAI8VWS0_9PEZI|nr:Uu.00g077440.m01.CDS01 [Anthostomella pinea]
MRSIVVNALALVPAVLASGNTCPFNYPAELNTTESHQIFTIASNSPVTNNRAIQLRKNSYLQGGFFAGIDATSPVLLGNFRGGGFYSEACNDVNQPYDLGPTGYLSERDEINGTHRYNVGFTNATIWPGKVERSWYLLGGSSDGTYELYHEEPLEVVNGSLLCTADIDLDSGPWYQLFYNTCMEVPHEFPGCEYVGVTTTVAATIYNGKCDIAGLVAS